MNLIAWIKSYWNAEPEVKAPDQFLYCKKFRWTLKGPNLDNPLIHWFKVDYFHKTIKFKVFDSIDLNNQKFPSILEWLKQVRSGELVDETLDFTAYNSCGCTLYTLHFSGIAVIGCNSCTFDTYYNDIATQTIEVNYQDMVLTYGELDGKNHGKNMRVGNSDSLRI